MRRAVRDAPIVVLHGDTALFGPAAGAHAWRARARRAARRRTTGEWFATGAPLSPMSTPLAGTAWDSLPPLDVSAALPPNAEFEVLETRRARRLDRRVAIVGWERPRRIVVAGASGFWRWRFRGGAGGDAFTAVWGSIFDWLAGERSRRAGCRSRPGRGARGRCGHVASRGRRPIPSCQAVLVRRGATARRHGDACGSRAGMPSRSRGALLPGLYDVQVHGGLRPPRREPVRRAPAAPRHGAAGQLWDAPGAG